MSLPTRDLGRRLERLRDRYSLVVIDTPPGHDPIIRGTLGVADLALIPVRPTPADVDRLWAARDQLDPKILHHRE